MSRICQASSRGLQSDGKQAQCSMLCIGTLRQLKETNRARTSQTAKEVLRVAVQQLVGRQQGGSAGKQGPTNYCAYVAAKVL